MRTDPRKVFVVYGRNQAARGAMFSFLRSLGLAPLEWEQAVRQTHSGAPHLGEILSRALDEVQAVVVLLTGDDEARLRPHLVQEDDPEFERDLGPQPRPNVLFESGMAFATHRQRTILVQIGEIRPFSDIAGRHVIRFDGSAQDRRALASRLQTVGCAVDLSGKDWLASGDFARAIELARPGEELATVPPPFPQPAVQVHVHAGFVAPPGAAPRGLLNIELENHSPRDLEYRSLSFDLEEGGRLLPLEDADGRPVLREELVPRGGRLSMSFDLDELLQRAGLGKIRAVRVRDGEQREFFSRDEELRAALQALGRLTPPRRSG